MFFWSTRKGFNSAQKFSYCFLLCSLNFHSWFNFLIFSLVGKFFFFWKGNFELTQSTIFLNFICYVFASGHLRFFHVFFLSCVTVFTFVLFIEKYFRNESVIILILSSSNSNTVVNVLTMCQAIFRILYIFTHLKLIAKFYSIGTIITTILQIVQLRLREGK